MANTLKFGNGKWYGKEGTILAYNDENYNYKPLPFNFERGSSATVINKDGLIETVVSDMPRIDYKDDSKGALLLEPSRTNYVLYSETEGIIRGSNGWSGDSDSIITQNYGTTPFNGSELKSTRIQFTGYSKEFRNIFPSVTIIPTCSIWIKGSVGKTIKFGSNGNEGVFTLNGEWQKLVQTGSSSSTSRLTINTYSSTTARDIEIFAPQLEQGSYATSYIPTQGSAVTRLADVCSQTPPSGIIGQTEGTMFIEIGKKITPSIALFECGQGSSQHRFFVYTDASSKLKVLIVNNYSVQVNYTSTVNVESNAKIAIGYANNNYAIYLNGSLLETDTSATVPPMNQIAIASDRGTIVTASNQIKETKLYNTRLSNSELQALTS